MREPGLHIVVYLLRRQVKKQLNYLTQLTQIVYQIPEKYYCEKQPQTFVVQYPMLSLQDVNLPIPTPSVTWSCLV